MKFSHLLLAASLCSFSAASAQTTPSTQDPRGTGTAAPSAGPSGTTPVASDPKGAVSAGEVFTTGAPDANKTGQRNKDTMKRKKEKGSMSEGRGKMKTKM